MILKLLSEERVPEIWVIDPEGRDLRLALHERSRLVRTRTRVKNALHSLAINHRLTLGPKLFTKFGRRAFNGLSMRPQASRTGQELWDWMDWLNPRVRSLDEVIAEAAAQRPGARLLTTHPGVGCVTALATVLILGPIERFPSPSHVVGYLGLAPAEHSTGLKRRLGRISKQGSTFLRYQMVEAANSAVRHEPTLKRFYRRTLCRRGLQKAKTAAARKLTVRLTIMLRDQIDYAEFARRAPRGRA